MKLYIAEKPSLGRAIADALPKPHKKHPGYIEVGNGDMVSWCIGHILEQAAPEAYDQRYKKWLAADLPILPDKWLLTPKSTTRSQLSVLRKLVKQADEIIHAGDPDREGQLLVDEVIDYFKVSKTVQTNIKRLLISDLNLPAVKRALAALKNNSEFMPLSVSALARSRADWLYGINLTRAYTLQGQKSGFNGVLSVGRVQTPLLGLVVARDLAIAEFVSHPYFDVYAHLVTPAGEKFIAKWQPSRACQAFVDENNRVLNKALAENVVRRISDQPAKVQSVTQTQKKQSAPLPYNLSALQIDAAKRFSMNAKLVLDVCQSLYEKHKLITYPRSDCRYLPVEQFQQAGNIIKLLANSSANYGPFAKNADTSIKSRAWNDSQVKAHHAIIPTIKSADNIALNSFEKNVYQLIVRQYLAQFYPDHLYFQTQLALVIAGGSFTVSANTEVQSGWKVMFKPPAAKTKAQPETPVAHEQQNLPKVQEGEVLHCTHGELSEKATQPPPAFTDATLLAAMTGIARYVSDENIKKILKETDGLGTEATRANIIDLLFKRGFLQRQGKQIKATELGISLINALPAVATTPDMTAQWEATLNAISEKQSSYHQFMDPLVSQIDVMVGQAQQQSFATLPSLPKPSFAKKRRAKKPLKSAVALS